MNYNIKYLLGEKKNFYKANLHSRSNLSDGALSREELKKIYKENGYSILAITDNEPLPQTDISDESFLVMSGFDFSAKETASEKKLKKSCTFTALSLNETPIAVNKFDAEYGSDKINDFLNQYKENGYFLTYDHPIRSLEIMPDFLKYKPIDAMEIMNYSSLCEGYDEYNGIGYDIFLRYGNRISCIATDGNRNLRPLDSERSDSFGAFTMINADSLKYEDIAKSLRQGNFYASEGPEINAIWVKGDSLNIRCSEADQVIVSAGRRRGRNVYSNDIAPLTAATFKIFPEDIFVRVVVVDKQGRKAYTNAYYVNELM